MPQTSSTHGQLRASLLTALATATSPESLLDDELKTLRRATLWVYGMVTCRRIHEAGLLTVIMTSMQWFLTRLGKY